jgi:EamA domain-containing membrane protein RarD
VFDFEIRGLISWILVIGIGVVTLLNSQGKQLGKANWQVVSVLATGIATVLMLLLVVITGDNLKPALGMWLAFISTIVAFVGSLMAFTGGGGNLKDLTDVNKLKDSFGQN